jgi:hypothetical protein
VVIGVADTAKITYHYVGSDTFEVDQTAPTVTFSPVNASSIENTSPFLRVKWDDDEYPGDSYTTVTLTKAELTDPAGTTTDVSGNFVSTDNKEYIWATSGLALGSYTLKVSGQDLALNKATDLSVSFTIQERAARSGTGARLEPGIRTWRTGELSHSYGDHQRENRHSDWLRPEHGR